MVRALFLVLVTLFVAQAMGVSCFVVQDDCTQACAGEAPEGHCPPLCAQCPCCFAAQVFIPIEPLVLTHARLSHSLLVGSDAAPTSMHAREIFHIPELRFA